MRIQLVGANIPLIIMPDIPDQDIGGTEVHTEVVEQGKYLMGLETPYGEFELDVNAVSMDEATRLAIKETCAILEEIYSPLRIDFDAVLCTSGHSVNPDGTRTFMTVL